MPENIATGLFSVLSAAIGGLIGYCSAISATVRKERNEAVLEFQLAFQRTLFRIDPRFKAEGVKVDVIAILESDFESHALAVMKFRQYIPREKAIELETAWANYHAQKTENGNYWNRFFHKYKPLTGDPEKVDIDTVIKNINNILEFAKLDHKSLLCRC